MDLERVNMLVADDGPSIAGKERGLGARMATVAPHLNIALSEKASCVAS